MTIKPGIGYFRRLESANFYMHIKFGLIMTENNGDEDEGDGDDSSDDRSTIELAINSKFTDFEFGLFYIMLNAEDKEFLVLSNIYGEYLEIDQLGIFGKYHLNENASFGLLLNQFDLGESSFEDLLMVGISVE